MAAAKTLGIKVVGLQVCEHLPKIASIADKIAVLRSVNAVGFPNAGDHNGGLSWKCGNRRGLAGTPKFPTYGSVVAKFAPTPQDLPPFVLMGDLDRMAPGMRENFLGPAYNPLLIHLGANQSGFTIDRTLMFPELTRLEVEQSEFQKRVQLQQALEKQLRHLESNNAVLEALDRFQQKAFSILQSPKLREAVDLSKESDQTKERYGLNIKGPYVSGPNTQGGNGPARMLAARRLIEAGVPFVHLDFGYWDWHPHDGLLENARALLHAFDAAFSALITDLDERGLLDTTLVVALGEMGRIPRFEGGPAKFARGHWAHAQIVLMAGGGCQGGVVVGATDAEAAFVKEKPYKVTSLGKTIYHLLGIDPDQEIYTLDNRPMRIIAEEAPLIREVLA